MIRRSKVHVIILCSVVLLAVTLVGGSGEYWLVLAVGWWFLAIGSGIMTHGNDITFIQSVWVGISVSHGIVFDLSAKTVKDDLWL